MIALCVCVVCTCLGKGICIVLSLTVLIIFFLLVDEFFVEEANRSQRTLYVVINSKQSIILGTVCIDLMLV